MIEPLAEQGAKREGNPATSCGGNFFRKEPTAEPWAKRSGKLRRSQSRIFIMVKMIGYMVTWTTYGSWLQGDRRGYVKEGQVLGTNKQLEKTNIKSQRGKTVKLTKPQREIVSAAIYNEAGRMGQKIYAISVCPHHVHLVVDCIEETIESTAARYKRATSQALREKGFKGKVWTRGYDKRFCFDEKSLRARVDYVKKHF